MPAEGYTKRRAKWTEEEVIAKIKEWVELYGDIPAATDWNSSDTRRAARHHAGLAHDWLERVRRFEGGEYPWTGTVYKLFGGWNKAIEAAGFDPRPPVAQGRQPAKVDDVAQALDEVAVMLSLAKSADNAIEQREQMYAVAERAMAIAEALS